MVCDVWPVGPLGQCVEAESQLGELLHTHSQQGEQRIRNVIRSERAGPSVFEDG
jgi:hypothetical protein